MVPYSITEIAIVSKPLHRVINIVYPTLISGNSFRGVLRIALESGFGGECASIPEALHALSVGFPKDKVVFDSPCKTKVIRGHFYIT